jgi:hypothetical protein
MRNQAEVQLERIDSRTCKEDCLQEIRENILYFSFFLWEGIRSPHLFVHGDKWSQQIRKISVLILND